MAKCAVLILAAGLGKRLGSDTPKVAVTTREMPLIHHVLSSLNDIQAEKIVVITGHKREVVEEIARDAKGRYDSQRVHFAVQPEQLGTGHAVKCALPELEGFQGTVLILSGDVPLISTESIRSLIRRHEEEKATITLVSAIAQDPTGFGRIVRDKSGKFVEKIVEHKDCSPEELLIREFNASIYAVDSAFLRPAVQELSNENSQKEYYLTDIVGKAATEGQTVSALLLNDPLEVQGVNTRSELNMINEELHRRQMKRLLDAGVIFEDVKSVFIEPSVTISPGARIGPNVQLRGSTKIATGAVLEGSAYLKDTVVSEGAYIKFGVRSEEAVIGANCSVGPFAHLRPGSVLEEKAKVGNFVETKKAHLKRGVAASHLTYLGDCVVGENTNIGAGTITCNYDGIKKSETIIEDNIFIGSNSALVAPVRIGSGAVVGAGSVITKNIEPDALALTRPPLVVKSDLSKRRTTPKK